MAVQKLYVTGKTATDIHNMPKATQLMNGDSDSKWQELMQISVDKDELKTGKSSRGEPWGFCFLAKSSKKTLLLRFWKLYFFKK